MESQNLIKYLKRSNTYNDKEYIFTNLPFWTAKVLVGNALEKGELLKAVEHVVGEPVEDTPEAAAFSLWIRDSYTRIIEVEKRALEDTPDAKMVNAGINDLNIFGDLNAIDLLAEGDVTKWDKIKYLPYSTVFDKLLMRKVTKEIQENLKDD